MTDVEAVAQRLVEVLALENTALKRFDFPAAVALVPAKEAALAALKAPPGAPIPEAFLANRLIGLATENQILLERAISVQTRIVRLIARAASPPPAAIPYNGYGARPASNRTTAALALSTRA
jgi:hypothetical protein